MTVFWSNQRMSLHVTRQVSLFVRYAVCELQTTWKQNETSLGHIHLQHDKQLEAVRSRLLLVYLYVYVATGLSVTPTRPHLPYIDTH